MTEFSALWETGIRSDKKSDGSALVFGYLLLLQSFCVGNKKA